MILMSNFVAGSTIDVFKFDWLSDCFSNQCFFFVYFLQRRVFSYSIHSLSLVFFFSQLVLRTRAHVFPYVFFFDQALSSNIGTSHVCEL